MRYLQRQSFKFELFIKFNELRLKMYDNILKIQLIYLQNLILNFKQDNKNKIMATRTSRLQKGRLQSTEIITQDKINLANLLKHLQKQHILTIKTMLKLIQKCRHILNNEPNLLKLSDPLLVVGDIHGQFFDFLQIIKYSKVLQSNFKESNWKVLFLGDYVDRGVNSMQVMTFIISLKIEYPNNIFLLRGNHQSQIMTQQYNFMQECCTKYNKEIYQQMLALFNLLPIACVVNDQYFCVHGGISDKISHIKQINKINRKIQIPLDHDSPFCDFIWSDPIDSQKGNLAKKAMPNTNRECSILYGHQLTKEFLKQNNFSTIIRGHQVFLQGYRQYKWNPQSQIPSVITIFSAPNYCGSTKNLAAVLFIQNNNMKIKQFKQYQPQKYRFLTKFDVFSWILPQILSNVNQIVKQIVDSVILLKIPALQHESYEKKVQILVRYAQQNKIKHFQDKKQQKHEQTFLAIKSRQFISEEQQRNYYFNKSHDYYAQCEKVPKH